MSARVFVVQEATDKNVLPAAKFGKLTVLLPPGQVVLDSAPTVDRLRRLLDDFSDQDFLLCIGDPVAIALAAAIAASQNGGRLQFLKWDRQERQYYAVEADIY